MERKKKNLTVVTAGALAGLLSGMFGALGGVAGMYIAAWANPEKGKDALRNNYAVTVCVMAAVSTVSLTMYALRGNLDVPTAFRCAVPAAAGGAVGALLCDRLPAGILRAVFAAVCIWAGWRMAMGG